MIHEPVKLLGVSMMILILLFTKEWRILIKNDGYLYYIQNFNDLKMTLWLNADPTKL